jgi:hypothetical protein
MRLQTPKTKSFLKASFVRFAIVDFGTTTSTRTTPRAQRSCGEGEEKLEKNESSGGEAVQRRLASDRGKSRARGSPRTADWQVAKWLSSALLLLLLPFLLLLQRYYGAQARWLFHAFVRSSLHFFSFFCLDVFYFFFIFGLSLLRALGGGGDGVWDHACRRPTVIYWDHLSTTTSFTAT